MRILIIGGTQFIRSFIVKRLTEMGNEVALFNGEQTNALPTGVNRIEGKRENLSDFREAFKEEPQPGTRKGERMSGNAPQAIPASSCNGTLRCADPLPYQAPTTSLTTRESSNLQF